MSEWINVNDGLPIKFIDSNGDALQFIICLEDYVTVAYFNGGSFYNHTYNDECYWYNDVTYWQPMPEPPSKNFKE